MEVLWNYFEANYQIIHNGRFSLQCIEQDDVLVSLQSQFEIQPTNTFELSYAENIFGYNILL